MSRARTLLTIGPMLAGFTTIAALIWADEYWDLPHRLFGAPPTRFRLSELVIELSSLAILASIALLTSWHALRRITELERTVMICASCRAVSFDGQWMRFDDFMQRRDRKRTSHGICDRCEAQQFEDLAGTGAQS